jgi:hypothetical protein
MGEGRYFTAHGVYPQGGYAHGDGVQSYANAPEFHDEGTWPQPNWPGQPAPARGVSDAYAPHPAPEPHTAWQSQPRAEPRLNTPYHAPQQAAPDAAWHGRGRAPDDAAYAPPYDYPAEHRPAYGAAPVHMPEQTYGQALAYHDPAQPHGRGSPSLPPVSMAGLARGFGAVMSLVLLIGGGVWTWQMMQRDVSGVPVVRALEGPLRVAPEDPGGLQAAHQGLSVNELAAEGESGLPDEIVLAPQPLDLEQSMTSPAQSTPLATQPETLIEVGLPLPGQGDVSATPLGFVSPNRSAVTTSPRPAARGTQVARTPQPFSPDETSPVDVTLAAAVANSVAADLSRSGGIDVDPASIGPGTRLVQLGAYDSVEEARTAWDTLAQRFSPLLDDRGRVIEAAHSGGSVFYRLRAHGFSDERDARRFCAALIDQRLDCIPVLIR